MLALWERSPRNVRDLSDTLALDPATLSPMLKRLEAAGLLSRTRSATDERILDVALTPAGRALRARAETVPPRVAALLDMSVDELTDLRTILHRVIAAVP